MQWFGFLLIACLLICGIVYCLFILLLCDVWICYLGMAFVIGLLFGGFLIVLVLSALLLLEFGLMCLCCFWRL